MRKYAKVSPSFWTGSTGRELKRRGSEAVVVALYLMSSPHSNMLGLFYQPVLYMAHETGLGIEGASKGLRGCIDAGFCRYDESTEMVWVVEMAAYQIADQLSKADKQCKGIAKDYESLPNCPFLGAFFERYSGAFHLPRVHPFAAASKPPSDDPNASPIEGGSKPGTGTGTGTGIEENASAFSPPLALLAVGAPAPVPDFDGNNAPELNCKSLARIAQGFELPAEWGIDAESLGFKPEDVLRESEKFRQYWTAGKGAGKRRTVRGWRQSWSNWLEKAARNVR